MKKMEYINKQILETKIEILTARQQIKSIFYELEERIKNVSKQKKLVRLKKF